MPILYFFGPDGSGKTTIATTLAKKLRKECSKVKLSWMRGTHTLASMLAIFLTKFPTFRGSDNPYYGISVPNRMKRLWQIIEFVSMLPILLTRFTIPSLLGYVIVAERYLPDFLTWVSLTTRDEDYLKRLEARFLLALSKKADVKVYVTASEAELAKRRSGEVNRNFLSRQIKLYEELAKIIRACKIDTTGRSIKETLNELISFVQPLMKVI
jgi:thymidylate kinase